MYYTWNTETGRLVRSGASNLSGLIGSQDPSKSNYELLTGTDTGLECLQIYKKNHGDVFLVIRKNFGLKIYCKIDSMHGLMQYLDFSKSLVIASEYIEYLDGEDEEDEDDEEEA